MKQMLRFELKEITTEGTFEGILSQYGVLDSTGDIVDAGAFVKTIKEHGTEVPLLWQHKSDTPVGMLELKDTDSALLVKGRLLMELPEAQKAYLLIKARIVKGLSIGFDTIKKTVKDGVRHLTELRLYEGSIVTFPALESALITSVKGSLDTTDDFNSELAQIQILDARYQLMQALSAALSGIIWADLTLDEKISATDTVLQQFVDAYSAFLPAYLDALTQSYGDMTTWSAKRHETKAGATISAATAEIIKTACDQIKSGHESLSALVEGKAGTATLPTKAVEPKSEPDEDHSAEQSLIASMRLLITR